jgi:hypothetical protein
MNIQEVEKITQFRGKLTTSFALHSRSFVLDMFDYFIRIMLCMNNIKVIIITRKTPISGCFCGTTSPFSIFSAGF